MNNKKVSEVSKKYKVSRTTIYNVIKDIEKLEDSSNYLIEIKGVKHFTDKGIEYLDNYFNVSKTDTDTYTNTDKTGEDNPKTNDIDYKSIIETLQKQLDYKDKQLDIKDKQIDKLHDVIDSLNRNIEQTNYIKALETSTGVKNNKTVEDTKTDTSKVVETVEDTEKIDDNQVKPGIWSKIKNIFK